MKSNSEFDKAFQIILTEIFFSKKLPLSFKAGLLRAFNDGSDRQGEIVAANFLLPNESGWLSNQKMEHYLFVEQFVKRLNFLTYGLIRRKTLEENTSDRPYWAIVCGGRGKCRFKHLENIARRHDSKFWESNMPPCSEKACGCGVRAFNKDGILEHGLLLLRD